MNWRLMFEGFGILIIGWFSIIWHIIKIIACIGVAVYICGKLGLTNYYWWCGMVFIISLLCKIVLYNNTNNANDNKNAYSDLVENYKKKIDEENELNYEMW